MKHYALVIDHEKCWGCKTCEVACKQEFEVAEGVRLIFVKEDGPRIVKDKPYFQYRVNVCRHCDDPPCADVCAEDAIYERGDGIVLLNDNLCTGCRLCLDACPFDAIDFDVDQGIARKCNLCHNRVDNGLIPACANNICLAHAIYFGDPKEIALEIE
jgi:tetrathionate reductase subunit B